MKKIFFNLFFILIPVLSFAQANPGFNRTFSFTAAGNSPIIPLQGLGLNYIKLSWDITGLNNPSLSACAFTLLGSKDGITFGTTHDSVANCTSDGQNRPVAVSGSTSQLRINVSSFTSSGGTPNLNVTIAAWDEIVGISTTDVLHVSISPDSTTPGGCSNFVIEPVASDNHTNIKNGGGIVCWISIFNNSATVNYGRLYDAGTGFNGCNSATNLLFEFQIPANTSVGGFMLPLTSAGLNFLTGLSICITGSYGQTSTTAATATAISANFGYR